MKFAKNLKDFIYKNNLSLKELAEKLDVPLSTVHGWINGVPPKSIKTLKRVSVLMNCSIDELCFDDKHDHLDLDPKINITIGESTFKVIFKKVEGKD